MEFAKEIGPDFFGGSPYILDCNTVTTSKIGNSLIIHGVLKEPTDLSSRPAAIGFCALEFTDAGAVPSHQLFRKAVSKFSNTLFNELSGISGSPVFDLTKGSLCGMVMRGGMNSSHECTIRYADVFDLMKFLDGVLSGGAVVDYKKPIISSELPPGLNLELKNAICS